MTNEGERFEQEKIYIGGMFFNNRYRYRFIHRQKINHFPA